MKTVIFILALLTGSFLEAQETLTPKTGKIIATVPNVSGTEGEVLFVLYNSENFMQREAEHVRLSQIENGQATGVFENIPSGTYAVVVLHDKNGNHRMDFDSQGMPLEDYGTSGTRVVHGPPNWLASRFQFEGGDKELEIRF